MTAFAPILEPALMRHGTAAPEQRPGTPASPA